LTALSHNAYIIQIVNISQEKQTMFIRTANNYDRDQASLETGLACLDKSYTQQQFKEESDINEIVRRFNITGQLPTVASPPLYQDFEGIFDYQSALNAIQSADAAFLELDAELRSQFNNNPAELMEFLDNPGNRDQAIELGLIAKPEAVLQPQSTPST